MLAAIDEKSLITAFTTLSDNHDVACHHAEIACGLGSFMTINKNQHNKFIDISKIAYKIGNKRHEIEIGNRAIRSI
ncbi:MAG: hypothetical protein A3C51_05625 [Omnitrophica bacterium RIFCSPHIGHO2_02_FULL_46_20]|nr:MAG: hypothetical protein A3C51_05625 [Omnitrophica bacterium RIFCSPHIGHO2_02_FULL_46_20]